MHERFTESAREVMQRARAAAIHFKHEYIGTEHILLGLLNERSGVAAKVLRNLNTDLRKIRLEVKKIVHPGPDAVTAAELPVTPRTRKVIAYSFEEARSLNNDRISAEHLLLGLMREEGGVAAHVLTDLGLTLYCVRMEVLKLVRAPDPGAPGRLGFAEGITMYERFTDRALKVMQLAHQEACRFNHAYLGTEHILLGLVKEGSGVAANVLKKLDMDLRKIRLEVEKIVPSGPDTFMIGKLAQTPRAEKVVEYSIEEARNLNHNYVGTEHLLLGLLREQEGVAAQVLMNLRLKETVVRAEVLRLLGPFADSDLSPGMTFLLERKLDPFRFPLEPIKIASDASLVERAGNWAGKAIEGFLALYHKPAKKGGNPPAGPSEVDRLAELEARSHSLELQLASLRFLLGSILGGMAGVVLGDRVGAVVGLLAGGSVALFGRLIPALLTGGITGAFVGSDQFSGEGGAVVGAVIGALLATCVAEVGRPLRTSRTAADSGTKDSTATK